MSVLLIQTTLFILFARNIDQQVATYIEREKSEKGYKDAHFNDLRQKLKLIWRFNKLFFIFAIFAFAYEVIARYNATTHNSCFIITDNVELNSLIWFANSINYFMLWQYALMYAYWPNKQKYKEERPHLKSVVLSDTSRSLISGSLYGDEAKMTLECWD